MSPRHTSHLDTDPRDPRASVPPAIEPQHRESTPTSASPDTPASGNRAPVSPMSSSDDRPVGASDPSHLYEERAPTAEELIAGGCPADSAPRLASWYAFWSDLAEEVREQIRRESESTIGTAEMKTIGEVATERGLWSFPIPGEPAPCPDDSDLSLLEPHQICTECGVDLAVYGHKMSCSRASRLTFSLRLLELQLYQIGLGACAVDCAITSTGETWVPHDQAQRAVEYTCSQRQNHRLRELVVKAFLSGFACSCEGFNGECAFEHLAPPIFPSDEEIESNRDLETLMKLAEEAADRIVIS